MKWGCYIEIILVILLKCGEGQLRRKNERQRLKGSRESGQSRQQRKEADEQPNSTSTLQTYPPGEGVLNSQIQRRCYNYLAWLVVLIFKTRLLYLRCYRQ